MARLMGFKDEFEIAFGNDPDVDRHGIVTPSVGLMNPNHYLAVAINYLLPKSHRLADGRADRQDPRLLLDDRSRGEGAGSQVE